MKRLVLSAQPDASLTDFMYYCVGRAGEWSHHEETEHFVEERNGIAEWDAEIVGDKKEEVRSLRMKLEALEKMMSAEFARDGAAASDDAGQNIGILNVLGFSCWH